MTHHLEGMTHVFEQSTDIFSRSRSDSFGEGEQRSGVSRCSVCQRKIENSPDFAQFSHNSDSSSGNDSYWSVKLASDWLKIKNQKTEFNISDTVDDSTSYYFGSSKNEYDDSSSQR